MINFNKAYFINQKISNIASKYEFYVDYLCIDRDAIRIRFRMFPAFPHYDGIPLIRWGGFAKDNLSNTYEYVGGACGKSSDGTHTEGVISFAPLPQKNTNNLEIILVSGGIDPVIECKVAVSLS
jgi:hypothetical protein